MSSWPHTFATQYPTVSLQWLDDQFNQLTAASTSSASLSGGALVGYIAKGAGASSRNVQNALQIAPQFFDSVSDLKASAGIDYPYAITRGYTTPGDGGGGAFWWNSSDTTSDNSGTIIAPNGGGTGRWNFVSNLVVPETFGAKGDGVSADDGALQSWINYISGGGSIPAMLGPKTYLCTGTVTISGIGSSLLPNHGNYTIRGCGPQSVIKLQSAIGIVIQDPSNLINMFKLADMQIYSSNTTSTLVNTQDLIGLFNIDSVTFNGGNVGLHLNSEASTNGSLAVHMRACQFNGQKTYGLWASPQATNLVENLHITDCEFLSQTGYSLYATGCDAVWVKDCRFERETVLGRTSPNIHIDTSFDVKVLHNYIEDAENLTLIEIGASVQEIDVSDNYLSVTVAGTAEASASAIKFTGTCSEVRFNRNHIVVGGNITTIFDAGSFAVSYLERVNNHIKVLAGVTVTNAWLDSSNANLTAYGTVFELGAGAVVTNKYTYTEPLFEGLFGVCASASYNGSSNTLILGKGVSSVTKSATGNYVFNLEKNIQSNAIAIAGGSSASNGTNICFPTVVSVTTAAITVNVVASGAGTGGLADSSYVTLVVLGDRQ